MTVRDIGIIAATGQQAIAGTFHTLVLQPTSFCNLDCSYCYLPDRRSRQLMSVSVATACARSIEQQGRVHPVSVVWHGGEPTAIPIDIFLELLAPFEELRRAGRVRHDIQTNATLIHERWCDLFAAYDFEIGISIDGPGMLNRNRLDRPEMRRRPGRSAAHEYWPRPACGTQ